MRPKKSFAGLPSAVPPLDPDPPNTCLNNQPSLSPTPPVAESNAAPRRAITSQRPISLVVRNTRKSRNKTLYTPVPRSNHYLLAKSLVENDQPQKPLAPERTLQETCKTAPSCFCHESPPPDFAVSDFIWRFSAPDPASEIHDALAALKFCDPQTFHELVAGFD